MSTLAGYFEHVPRDDLKAGVLAAAVHVFFLSLLMLGVSWQIHDPQPIMAELWSSLPEVSVPQPQPVVEPEPSPPAPVPASKPALEPPVGKQPDIALEKKQAALKKQKEKEERELALKQKQDEAAKAKQLKEQQALEQKQKLALAQKQKQEEERKQQEAARLKLEAQKQAQAFMKQQLAAEEKQRRQDAIKRQMALDEESVNQQVEQEQTSVQAKIAEQKKREALKQDEDLRKQMMQEMLAGEDSQIASNAAAAAHEQEVQKLVDQYKAKISDKVRGNTRLPDGLKGNPYVEFMVSVLPTGEVASIKLNKSSGQPDFDEAVRQAIQKSSPFEIPKDRDAAVQFRNLLLKHKARE